MHLRNSYYASNNHAWLIIRIYGTYTLISKHTVCSYVAVVAIHDDVHLHTCCYSEKCIAATIIWCINKVVSSIGFHCISNGKSSSQCIVSSRSIRMDIAALLEYSCGTPNFTPLYIITVYVPIILIQHTSECC